MAILTYLHKILQYPVCNRLYIYVHREGLNTPIMANECLCQKFYTIDFTYLVSQKKTTLCVFHMNNKCLCNYLKKFTSLNKEIFLKCDSEIL